MKNKGFTILEILVVISVIAILIGIAIPRFQGMQMEANIIKAKSEMRTIQAAIESFRNQAGTYAGVNIAALEGATPQIINADMANPFIGGDYGIDLSTDNLYYVVYAASATGGVAEVANTGAVTKTGSVYCLTNGDQTDCDE